MRDCSQYIDRARADGVHELLVDLVGCCPCGHPGQMGELFGLLESRALCTEAEPRTVLRAVS